MTKIGVEESLSNVKQALRSKGYEIIDVKQAADARNLDCYVVTGLESNVMGINDTSIKASIIEADGLSADEVCREVENKINSIQ